MVGNHSAVRELEQTRRRRQRKRNLKMYLGVSAIIFQLFKVIMLAKCVPTILIQELIWNTKLNICHHMLRSSIQLQNRSFHVVERTRTSAKCLKMTNARAKRAELLFFIVKYANLWRSCCRPRRSCFKLPFMYYRGLVSRNSRKTIHKTLSRYSVKLVFSYVVKGIKIKITAKFCALRRLCLKIQRELCHLKCTHKVLGLSTNRLQGLKLVYTLQDP